MFERLHRCYIIAEIGGNFTTYEEAVKLVDGAEYAGVDCVKLQTYRAETISCKDLFFDMESTGKISQYEYFKKYEISEDLHKKVIDYIKSKGLEWFSTPSHPSDVDMLMRLGIKAFKVGADDATNIPLLKYIAGTGLPIVLSTGMCTLDEVREAVDAILEEGDNKIIILHTVSGYPTYPEWVNLNVLQTLRDAFPDFPIGFSDHTLSPLASIAAAAMGAMVIERHFTYDKNAEGPDHMISSTPEEMKYIVDSIREIEKMRGASVKMPYGPEVQNRINNRKSVVALKDIKKGEEFAADNISVKRPGTGIPPKHYQELFGKKAARDIKEDDVLEWGDIN